MGWRTFKAAGHEAGSRLMRDGDDDSLHFQVRESYSGPTAGMIFVRMWNSDPGFYTVFALTSTGALEATANGKTDKAVWDNITASLKQKGIG